MSLHIYNPPAPHADPVTGYIDQRQGERCGLCSSCPRDWLLDCGAVAPPYDQMGGKRRLVRDLSDFKKTFDTVCMWFADVILDPLQPPPYQQGDIGHWRLYYGAPPEEIGTGPISWWIVADVRDNPGSAAINAWLPREPFTPIAGAHWTQPNFNCLGPNSFDDNGLPGFPGVFPRLVKVQPLWA